MTLARTRTSSGSAEINANIQRIEEAWSDCRDCELCGQRKRVVFWRGNPDASVAIIGEAPGALEDERGIPYIGKAGKLLDEAIYNADANPRDFFIANLVGCRPPGNREPTIAEVIACSDRLASLLFVSRAEYLLLTGGVAMKRLLGRGSVVSIRGSIRTARLIYGRTLLEWEAMATWHPAYILRCGFESEERKQFFADVRDIATIAGLR